MGLYQPSLFDQPKPVLAEPVATHVTDGLGKAAETARRKRASGVGPGVPNRNAVYFAGVAIHKDSQLAILRVLELLGEATAHEVGDALFKTVNQISGRFTELAQLKVIEHTGEKRKTPTGSPAHVWRIRKPPASES